MPLSAERSLPVTSGAWSAPGCKSTRPAVCGSGLAADPGLLQTAESAADSAWAGGGCRAVLLPMQVLQEMWQLRQACIGFTSAWELQSLTHKCVDQAHPPGLFLWQWRGRLQWWRLLGMQPTACASAAPCTRKFGTSCHNTCPWNPMRGKRWQLAIRAALPLLGHHRLRKPDQARLG